MGNKKTRNVNGILFVLSVMMAFCISLPVRAEESNHAKQFTEANNFAINEQGIVTQYTGTEKEVVIPSTISGKTVLGLSGTFTNNVTVERIIVPDSITTIGDNTFNGCTSLSGLYIYEKNQPISSADDITDDISNYVYDQSGAVFYKLVNKDSNNNVNCAVIPASVQTIGKQVFGGKNRISSFRVMENNPNFATSVDGRCLLTSDKKNIYRFAPGYICNGTYNLPEYIETIGSYAFEQVHIDGGIQFNSNLLTISDYGFYNFGNVANNFKFPDDSKLTTIGSYAFANNPIMQIKLPKSVKLIGSYCFIDSSNVAIDISETQIETLTAYAFYDCSALHQITMPATLKCIEAYAFAGCNNLDTVYFLGDRLEKLGEGAFKGCPTLHNITIPEGVVNIEDDTFNGCTNLAEVVLPDSVKTIGDNAFKDCRTIEKLVIPPNVEYISNSSFEGANQTNIDTSKNEYASTIIKGKLPGKDEQYTRGNLIYKVTKSDETKGTVTVVKAINKKQKNITIPATVNINGYDFKVTAIANKAFKKNTKLKSVIIGDNVKTIGKEAFSGCKALKTITVKSKVVSKVNKNAFKGINKKAKIKLPKLNSKKFKKYKKKFEKKGQAATVKITK